MVIVNRINPFFLLNFDAKPILNLTKIGLHQIRRPIRALLFRRFFVKKGVPFAVKDAPNAIKDVPFAVKDVPFMIKDTSFWQNDAPFAAKGASFWVKEGLIVVFGGCSA
jgi:hypothetical protein